MQQINLFCLRPESGIEASSSSIPSTASVPLASSTSNSTSQQQPERSPYFGTAGQDSAEPQTTRLVTVAYFNRQVKSCVNLIEIDLSHYKYPHD